MDLTLTLSSKQPVLWWESMNKFYTAQEVADKLKIKKTTVYELIKRGELSSSKIGKQLRVSEDQLSLYLNLSLIHI